MGPLPLPRPAATLSEEEAVRYRTMVAEFAPAWEAEQAVVDLEAQQTLRSLDAESKGLREAQAEVNRARRALHETIPINPAKPPCKA